ncbi:hypothetical protein HGRIS_012282 [Hohenbuehelia grisea]|uniref:Uncharacterized protein n=1 Tax=Hohenbuehelia grisea TaxID=104357 RepID=A0ABR3IRR2_9AGAR
MHRCHELKRLPKAGKVASVVFRNQSPGSPAQLFNPKVQPCTTPSETLLQPMHPATKMRKGAFPWFNDPALRAQAFPFAVLDRPTEPPKEPIARQLLQPATWDERIWWFMDENKDACSGLRSRPKRMPMSLFISVPKRTSSKKACLRGKIRQRVRTAISLVVARGADGVRDKKGRMRLVMDEKNVRELVKPGWTYLIHPALSVYRMPYPELVHILRKGLLSMYTGATRIESRWTFTIREDEPVQEEEEKLTHAVPVQEEGEKLTHAVPVQEEEKPTHALPPHMQPKSAPSHTRPLPPPAETTPQRDVSWDQRLQDLEEAAITGRPVVQRSAEPTSTLPVETLTARSTPTSNATAPRHRDLLARRFGHEDAPHLAKRATRTPVPVVNPGPDLSSLFKKLRKHTDELELVAEDGWPATGVPDDNNNKNEPDPPKPPNEPVQLKIPRPSPKAQLFGRKMVVLPPKSKP